MNPYYHPYSDLSSPHPPSPDNNNYSGLGGGHGHHNGHTPSHQMDSHHMNNNNGSLRFCAGCGGKISERFYLHAMERYWHNSCLKCNFCHAMLGDIGSKCYTRGNMILCKTDYAKMFGSGNCSACNQNIPPTELVMRTTSQVSNTQQPGAGNQPNQVQHHVFHVKCFACSKCGLQLVQGDRYYMLAGAVVCESDWLKLMKSSGTTGTAPLRKGKVGRPRRSRD